MTGYFISISLNDLFLILAVLAIVLIAEILLLARTGRKEK
jgi:hypothetical protein